MLKNFIGVHKFELDTPALVIDKNKLINNLAKMQKFAQAKNIYVRPHAKTHKCSKIAKLQLQYGSIGISVAKVSEAYVLAKSGITGILITSPIVTKNKIQTLIEILKIAPDTLVVIDNLNNAESLNSSLSNNNVFLNVLLDIDAGIGRTGISVGLATNLAFKINNLSNLNCCGIQCYAGHIQHIKNYSDRALKSTQILAQAGEIKNQLLQAGLNCKIQTGSGTGSFSIDADIATVTEIQPGSYVVMDQEYLDIEVKDQAFEPSMTMLTSVISINHKTHVTVDAGTKALYTVETKPHIISHQNLIYDWGGFGDEHGKVSATEEKYLPKLGAVIELVVAHCDPTINLFDYFYITENDIVIDRWDIDLRGKCQ